VQNFNSLFPQNADLCYLNHAAVSPWPKPARDAAIAFAEENCTRGAQFYPDWLNVENRLRQRFCQLLHTSDTGEIALAKSTSEALSMIAYGLRWHSGDEIIVTNHEFPSNRIVWESLANRGVHVRLADISDSDPVEAIIAATNTSTRLISVSSVQYASGIRIDLEQLSQHCRQNGILLCVDAIQSLGAIPFDQQAIQADFIVADGHKWMMAAEGLALFYIKRSLQGSLSLNEYGWHMVKHRGDYDRNDWEPADDATRFECGSPNMLGAHVLDASLGCLLEIGMDNVYEQLQLRVDHLIKGLSDIPHIEILSPTEKSERGGIVTFVPHKTDNLKALHSQLMKAGVVCACRGGGIRFSPHFYTPETSLDAALKILGSLL